ncbi:MAG: hypothetical protein RRB13_09700 [bacterium]|nr:hypothetical protein [bacterium]
MTILTQKVTPFVLNFALLVLATLAIDGILHSLGLLYLGRWAGLLGVLILASSFAYSLRKRKLFKAGPLPLWLRSHEFLAWLGALLILVHSGVHFNAVLPWAATLALLVATGSGLVGKYLLKSSREQLKARRAELAARGLAEQEQEEALIIDSLTLKALGQWKRAHLPITATFLLLSLVHIISILWFWS